MVNPIVSDRGGAHVVTEFARRQQRLMFERMAVAVRARCHGAVGHRPRAGPLTGLQQVEHAHRFRRAGIGGEHAPPHRGEAWVAVGVAHQVHGGLPPARRTRLGQGPQPFLAEVRVLLGQRVRATLRLRRRLSFAGAVEQALLGGDHDRVVQRVAEHPDRPASPEHGADDPVDRAGAVGRGRRRRGDAQYDPGVVEARQVAVFPGHQVNRQVHAVQHRGDGAGAHREAGGHVAGPPRPGAELDADAPAVATDGKADGDQQPV